MNSSRSRTDRTHAGLALTTVLASALLIEARVQARPQAGQGRQAIAAPQERDALVRFRFDEPIELRLDPDRVAVWFPRGVRPVVPATLASAGIEELGPPGWHLLRLETPVDAAGLPVLLADLAPALGCEFVSPVFVDDLGGPLVPTRDLLVQFAPEVEPAEAEAVLAASGAGAILEREWGGLPRAYRLRSASASGIDVLASANALARRPDVRFAEPDFLFTGQATQCAFDDPHLALSWAVNRPGFRDYCLDVDLDLRALEAWRITPGDPGVRVLVMDCGVDPLHPDLNLDPGVDFTGEGGGGAPVNTCDQHGTAVAGCIAMIGGNGLGSVGIAPGCKVVSARIWIMNASCNGSFSTAASWTVDALQWARDHDVWITNLSGSYGFTSAAIDAKYQQTRSDGVLHFSGAGNSGTDQITYPANLDSVLAVGNFTYWGYVNPTSSYGPQLDFVAPGTWIYTTDRSGAAGYAADDFVYVSGASFACAFAAGVAALVRSHEPGASADSILARMQASAFDLEAPGWDEHTGWGLVRAGPALTLSRWRPFETAGSVPGGTGASLLGSGPNHERRTTSDRPSFSDDGRFAAFRSFASDLVLGDTNRASDVFVRDLQTGTVLRASVASAGAQANGPSGWPSISDDGRYVAFESQATNLVAGDTNGRTDVFLRDTLTGTTTRLSVSTAGSQGNANSLSPCMTPDGRYVVFQSFATSLDPAANGYGQVYVHDRVLHTTTLVTRDAGGAAANSSCHLPTISDDGSRVAFFGKPTNLVAGPGGESHAFVWDRPSTSFQIASVDVYGALDPVDSYRATISGDGNRVAFWTTGVLHPLDWNDSHDVYVRDLTTGETLPASTDSSGLFGEHDVFGLQLSFDGRYVVLLTAAPLVPGDTNGLVDAFRKDLETDAVVRVSLTATGQQASGGSTQPWISSDGTRVGFVCADDRLVPGDSSDGYSDVYLHTVPSGQTVLASGN